ncbi:MAG: SoxR reducing system RseC family protein [Deltaproteobacteria bacterium]
MSEINHKGVITRIENGIAEVLITDKINCEGCGAKSACISGNSNDKKFNINLEGKDYNPGDEVYFSLSQSSAINAVIWAYIFPFFVLVGSLLLFSLYFSEIKSALFSISLLAFYYVLIFINKRYFDRKFRLKIKNNSDE